MADSYVAELRSRLLDRRQEVQDETQRELAAIDAALAALDTDPNAKSQPRPKPKSRAKVRAARRDPDAPDTRRERGLDPIRPARRLPPMPPPDAPERPRQGGPLERLLRRATTPESDGPATELPPRTHES